jgi:hypothetical protein
VGRGRPRHDPDASLRAATLTGADLIDVNDRGRLAPGCSQTSLRCLATPSEDITVTQDVRFVMKDGQIYKGASGPDHPGHRGITATEAMVAASIRPQQPGQLEAPKT